MAAVKFLYTKACLFVRKAAATIPTMKNIVTVRLATSDDFEKVLEISEGIYDGEDYLPIVFHDWLKDKRRLVLLGELQGNIIGLDVPKVAINGQSFFAQALRLHPNYRGQRLSYKLAAAVVAHVQSKHPQVSKRYFVCFREVLSSIALAKRIGAKILMEQNFHMTRNIISEKVQLKIPAMLFKGIHSYDRESAVTMFMNPQLLDKMILLEYGVFQLPDDIDDIVKQGDQIFADAKPEEIHEGKFPTSFSHGRVWKTQEKTQWMCNVFTEDAELFKKHIRCQLDFAAKNIAEFDYCIFQSSSSKFDGAEILKEELSRLKLNNEVTSDIQVLFEQAVDGIV